MRLYSKNYIITNHKFPLLIAAPTPDQKKDSLLAQILHGVCTNNGWEDKCTTYGINQNDHTALDNLAVIMPSLNFNEWNMENRDNAQNWTNTAQNQYIGTDDNGIKYSTYQTIMQGGNKVTYDTVPSGDDAKINIIMNAKAMMNRTKPFNDTGISSVQAEQNFANGDDTFNVGNTNNIANLSARTNGAISQANQTFTNTSGTKTTTGVAIAKSGNIIRAVNDPDIADKCDVMIKAYVDAPQFYDTKQANPKFDQKAYDSDKYSPDNQPYLLLPAGKIYNDIKSSQGGSATVDSVLKQMFYDHKNNNESAIPFANVNLYDNDSFAYDVPAAQVDVTIDDGSGQMTTKIFKAGDDHSSSQPIMQYTTSGFSQSTDPFVPSGGGVSGSMVGAIVGGCLGGAAVIAITCGIVFSRRRSVKSLNPQVKRLRKLGENED